MVIEIINTGFEYLGKGLDVVRNVIIKISGWLPWEEELSLAILFLALSIFLSYKFVSKFTIHPLSTQNIIYLLVLSFMMFTIFMYL